MNSAIQVRPSRLRDIGKMLAYIYFVLFGLVGLVTIGEKQPVPGMLFILSAIFAFPPITNAMLNRVQITVPIWTRVACTVGLLFAAGLYLPSSETSESHASQAQSPPLPPTFVPLPRGVAVAKLLMLDDFQGYLEGKKVLGNWSSIYPLGERVTATQYYLAYHANEVAADDRFKDKSLVVSGAIESINKGIFDDAYLDLRDGSYFDNVEAFLTDESKKYSSQLSRGDSVTLICTGGAMTMHTFPRLNSCEAVPVVVGQVRQKVENIVDSVFSGEGDFPDHMRAIIGLGYTIGVALPDNNACQAATPGNTEQCSQQMRSVSKEQERASYLELSKHISLPAFKQQ